MLERKKPKSINKREKNYVDQITKQTRKWPSFHTGNVVKSDACDHACCKHILLTS